MDTVDSPQISKKRAREPEVQGHEHPQDVVRSFHPGQLNFTPDGKDVASEAESNSGDAPIHEHTGDAVEQAASPGPEQGLDRATVRTEPPPKRRRTHSGSADTEEPGIQQQNEIVPKSAPITTYTFTIEVKGESRSPSPSLLCSGDGSSRVPEIDRPTTPVVSMPTAAPSAVQQPTPPSTPPGVDLFISGAMEIHRPRTPRMPGALPPYAEAQQPTPPSTPLTAQPVFMRPIPAPPPIPLLSEVEIDLWPEVHGYAACGAAAARTQEFIERYLGAVEAIILPLVNNE
ncbi:hypothetical protein DFH07DRAFT_1014041 [Mycena maculata]|uniref:Uncharacterized protein n=1 Tax=Mycena maculata TaxID=230809 RepID=A0AAD7MGS4_9AGAR|nr:hypothetical protein DFH07DRAFT_1014041 [Mycena maculata]